MTSGFIDQGSGLDSFLHRRDPRIKFLTTLAFILAVVATPPTSFYAFGGYFVLIMGLLLLSRVPLGYVFKRSLAIGPFVLLLALFLPFLPGGEVAGSYNVGLWQLSVTKSGLLVAWNVVVKAWLSILATILLASTTRFPDLLQGIGKLGVPKVMILILSFMYRYLFVLEDEAIRMWRARESRHFGYGGKRGWQMETVGRMIGTLFIRSYERGERAYAAMLARGFEKEMPTLTQWRFRKIDLGYGAILFLVLVAISLTTVFI